MQLQLTDDQIARARAMRSEGKSFAEIKDAIGADVEPATIRQHCLDVPVMCKNGKIRTRVDSGPRRGKDGRTITPYRPDEDAEIIAWATSQMAIGVKKDEQPETMAALAGRLGRLRHSVAARIKTLRKHGRIPAL
jgi:hypothetical protein